MENNRKFIAIHLAFLVFFSLMNCGEKTEKFEVPHTLFFYNPSDSVSFFKKENDKFVEYEEKIVESDEIVPDRIMLIEEDLLLLNNKSHKMILKYIVAKCPKRLVNVCHDNDIYLKKYPSNAFLIKKADYEKEKATRDWFLNPTKVDRVDIDPEKFNSYTSYIYKDEEERLRFIGEVIIIAEIAESSKFDNSTYKRVFDKYPVLNKNVGEEDKRFKGIGKNKVSELNKRYQENLLKFVKTFPSNSKSIKGIADHFNKLQIPFAKEKILDEVLKNCKYTVNEKLLNYRIQNRDSDRFTFCEINPSNSNLNNCTKSPIESIQAVEDKGSIGFVVKFKDEEIYLNPPDEIPYYFLSCEQCLKNFKKSITKSYQEILKEYSKEEALKLVAIKHGEGGFDKDEGFFKYTLSSDKNYWVMFEIFKRLKYNYNDEEFSGSISNEYQNGTWRQPKGKLYISLEGGGEMYEYLCMEIDGSEEYLISFGSIDEKSDMYKTKIEYSSSSDECMRTINHNIKLTYSN